MFYWEDLNRSVRVEGDVEKVTPEESMEYFRTRPRESQLVSLMSKQSRVVEGGRPQLDSEMEATISKYAANEGDVVLTHDTWGGKYCCISLARTRVCWCEPIAISPDPVYIHLYGVLGYRVVPHTIEFWQHGEHRLHDRLRYHRLQQRDGDDSSSSGASISLSSWVMERLYP